MKELMIMKKTMMILMAVALIALPTMAQKNWGTQRPVYGSQYRPKQATMPIPSSYFQFTNISDMRTASLMTITETATEMLHGGGSGLPTRGAPTVSAAWTPAAR